MIYYKFNGEKFIQTTEFEYICLCHKFVIFTDADQFSYCIDPIAIYSGRSYDGIKDKLQQEKRIGKEIARKIKIPKKAFAVSFSDMHGDLLLYSIGNTLYKLHHLPTINGGDIQNYRWDFWDNDKSSEYENNRRIVPALSMYEKYMDEMLYITLRGNHDRMLQNIHGDSIDIRVIVVGKNQQFIFQHALIAPEEEEFIYERRRFIYNDYLFVIYTTDKDYIRYHHSTNPIKKPVSLHASGPGYRKTYPEPVKDIEDRLCKMIDDVGSYKMFNPYIVVGHDFQYSFVAANIAQTTMFPFVTKGNRFERYGRYPVPGERRIYIQINNSNVCLKRGKRILRKIICTDGMPKMLH